MMRLLGLAFFLAALGGGAYYADQLYPELKHDLMEKIKTGKYHTLEARLTPTQIMEMNRWRLLKDENHKFLEPALCYYPYILMEVKYSHKQESATGEGVILWDLLDGEMVINSKNWEKTHGFGDCIKASVEKSEFKVLNLLARRGGALDREGISKALHIENEILDSWIDSCRKKKLVIQAGNLYRLHLQQPHLDVLPETYLAESIATKTFEKSIRLPRRFKPNQVHRIAAAAFGQNFAIRKTIDVYLPVYTITVQNPDGTIQTSYWNALNGQQISFCNLID